MKRSTHPGDFCDCRTDPPCEDQRKSRSHDDHLVGLANLWHWVHRLACGTVHDLEFACLTSAWCRRVQSHARHKHGVSPQMFRVTLFVVCSVPFVTHAAESVCYGTPSNGRLENGVKIEESGSNFEPYSSLGVTLGRTYIHSRVARVIMDAYVALAKELPNTMFVYGESGWSKGGRIKPHRTHQNGLAVDFMVPVRNKEGISVPLPSGITNRFGYDLEFDRAARNGDLTIDFDAIAEHLHALYSAAGEHHVGIARVIFDPQFIPKLYKTKRGEFIKKKITFMQGQAWVRHDEHYHVDFSVTCKPLKGQQARAADARRASRG